MVTNISYFGTDSISLFLSSAVKNLRILHEAMESDLLAQQRSGISSGPEYLLDCCDAMTTVLQALDRINEELDAIADMEYNVKKEVSP